MEVTSLQTVHVPAFRTQLARVRCSHKPPRCLSSVGRPLQTRGVPHPSAAGFFSRRRVTQVACHASADEPASLQAASPAQQKVVNRLAILLAVVLGAFVLYCPAHALAKACCEGAGSVGGGFSISGAAKGLLSFVLHLDKHLAAIIARHGQATYAILFAIVFAETGFVLTPFLPGDSLLFAAGAFAALGSLNVWAVSAVFIVAAILGDALNYSVGNYLGAKAIETNLVKKEYVAKTEAFYAKHGGKTVVLARFVPIVRTFAPFVAGVGSMPYKEFCAYNVGGALLWTALFVGAGFFFGNLEFVRHNFTLVVLAIVAVSVLPIAFEVAAARRESATGGEKGGEQEPPPMETPWRVAPPPS